MKKEYKYDRGDGVMVSRQRIWQIRNRDKQRALQKRYNENHRVEQAERNRQWREKFKEEHGGISYSRWHRGERPDGQE